MRPLHFEDATGEYTEAGRSASSAQQEVQNNGGRKKNEPQIGVLTALFMVLLAVVADALQIVLFLLNFVVPGLGVILSFLLTVMVGTLFAFWFLLSIALTFGSGAGQKMLILGGIILFELIPFLNGLPGLTIGISILVWRLRSGSSGYTRTNGKIGRSA